GIWRHGVMGLGIESVIDGVTIRSTQAQVVLYHGRSAAVCEDEIIFGNKPPEGITRIAFNSRKGDRGVYVPECNSRHSSPAIKNTFFQQLIKNADAAVFDHQVTVAGAPHQVVKFALRLIDDRLHIRQVAGIPLLLTAISVRLSKSNVVPEGVQLFVDAAVISGCTVPVRRGNAGTKDE